MSTPFARFDDLVVGSAIQFGAPADVLVAENLDQVASVLAAVDDSARHGRWAYGFVAYEAAPAFDPGLRTHEPTPGLPLAWFALSSAPRAVQVVRPASQGTHHIEPGWQDHWSQAEYERRVGLVHSRIAAGDTYQCNLTTRLSAGFEGEAHSLYADLALAQQGAYNAFIDTGSHAIASASPELFFDLADSRVLLRPMKGTAPRGRTADEDARLVADLVASEKERAENIMIVDLLRNDVSRIAQLGGVSVPRLVHAERYPTVHQLTSDVVARVASSTTVLDVFTALFPCGSITGAPKWSTMQLIRELESGPRGVYCGAVGYVRPTVGGCAQARFSVAIRTVTIDLRLNTAVYGTGSAITWSSNPASEHAEIGVKSAVLNARRTATLGAISRPTVPKAP